jgi:hypothetical protein
MKTLIASALLLVAPAAFANPAIIRAETSDGKQIEIMLDAKGIPSAFESEVPSPSIKDFREEFSDVCYQGSYGATSDLLQGLISAADGDGDSWAEGKSIQKTSDGVITVVVAITDESGENVESFSFPRCK